MPRWPRTRPRRPRGDAAPLCRLLRSARHPVLLVELRGRLAGALVADRFRPSSLLIAHLGQVLAHEAGGHDPTPHHVVTLELDFVAVPISLLVCPCFSRLPPVSVFGLGAASVSLAVPVRSRSAVASRASGGGSVLRRHDSEDRCRQTDPGRLWDPCRSGRGGRRGLVVIGGGPTVRFHGRSRAVPGCLISLSMTQHDSGRSRRATARRQVSSRPRRWEAPPEQPD